MILARYYLDNKHAIAVRTWHTMLRMTAYRDEEVEIRGDNYPKGSRLLTCSHQKAQRLLILQTAFVPVAAVRRPDDVHILRETIRTTGLTQRLAIVLFHKFLYDNLH